ncbi:MAG TPA: hypothetical protein VH796_01525 [Nitrososphaeraceae archaeon]
MKNRLNRVGINDNAKNAKAQNSIITPKILPDVFSIPFVVTVAIILFQGIFPRTTSIKRWYAV